MVRSEGVRLCGLDITCANKCVFEILSMFVPQGYTLGVLPIVVVKFL